MASQLRHGHGGDTGTVNSSGLDRKPCLGLGKVYHGGYKAQAQEAGLVSVWRRLVAKLMNRGLTEVTSSHPSSHLLGGTPPDVCVSQSRFDFFSFRNNP